MLTKTYKDTIDDDAVVVEIEVKNVPDDDFSMGVGFFIIFLILGFILMAITFPSPFSLLFPLTSLVGVGIMVVARYRRKHPVPPSSNMRIITFDKRQRTIRIERGPLRGESREFNARKYKVKEYPVEKLNSIKLEAMGFTHRVYVGIGLDEYCVYAGNDAGKAAVLQREISRLKYQA